MSDLKTFAFLDEAGNPNINHKDNYFAVGAIIHPWPDETIIKLHKVFGGLCSLLKKDPSRMELKFSEIKSTSKDFYIQALRVLEDDEDWRFCSVVIDKTDPKFDQPKDKLGEWECYLRWTKLLLQKNLKPHEHATLLADYYNRPSGPVHSFATLPSVVPMLHDVLQVESTGILLVQMADVLLGSTLHTGTNDAKKEVSEFAMSVLNKTRSGGFNRHNQWKPRWS